jgi:ABC-type polysaccharide/polyol phosphate export permease
VWTADPYAVAPPAPRPAWPPASEQAESAAAQNAQGTQGTPKQEAAPEILPTARLVGYFFLMMVPLVNLVCACVWSFGRRTGAQLKALARASLIVILTLWSALVGLVYLAVVYGLPQLNAMLNALFGPM